MEKISIEAKKHVLNLLMGAMQEISRHIMTDIKKGNTCINDVLYEKHAKRIYNVIKDISNDYDDISIIKRNPRVAYISRNEFSTDESNNKE